MRIGAKLVLALAMGVSLPWMEGPSPAMAELKQLRMTIPAHTFTFYTVFVAQDKKFFNEEGYNFEIVVTGGDGPDVDALMAGNVDFTATPPHRLFIAYEQGKRLLVVANLMNRCGINCFMNKTVADRLGITEKTPLADKIKALRGLTIGGTRAGAFTYSLGLHYVRRGGYVPQQDVKVIPVGVGPSMIASVEHNQIDIGCEASPVCEQSVLAGKSIMWVNNTKGEDPEFSEFLMEALYVRPEYAAKNPDVVRGVVRALVRALRFIAEGPEEEHMVVLRNRFKGVPDAVLRESLKNVRGAVEPTGRISPRSVEAHLKFVKAAGLLKMDIPWNELVTNEYLPK